MRSLPLALAAAFLLSSGAFADNDTGEISGVVKWDGPAIRRKTVKMQGNAFCMAQHGGQAPLEAKYALGKDDKTVPNVLVHVTKGLEGKSFETPQKSAVLDQVKCIYTPHVVAVMTGQSLEIRNSDEQLHNVMASPFQNRGFNFGMPKKGTKTEKIFKIPELKVKFQCALHPWMYAYVHVLPHPFFAVTGDDGTFSIKGLPPGEYEVSVLHESARMKPEAASLKVTVKAGEKSAVQFTYGDGRRK